MARASSTAVSPGATLRAEAPPPGPETTVRHRLAAFLLRLAKREGTKTAGGIAVTLPDNNQEVAAQIGAVRELVSRNLSRFEAEGLIKIDGRNLVIRDLKAIESEVSEES